jgi:hypothetical protein
MLEMQSAGEVTLDDILSHNRQHVRPCIETDLAEVWKSRLVQYCLAS